MAFRFLGPGSGGRGVDSRDAVVEPPEIGFTASPARAARPRGNRHFGSDGYSIGRYLLLGCGLVDARGRKMWRSVAAIAAGAALGAVLRWSLGTKLNALFPSIPPGTLAANLIGGYLIGLAIGFFATLPSLPPEWRLFAITGFCGGLTTFSTFSAEVLTLLQQGRLLWALAAIGLHLVGSVLLVLAGVATIAWLRQPS